MYSGTALIFYVRNTKMNQKKKIQKNKSTKIANMYSVTALIFYVRNTKMNQEKLKKNIHKKYIYKNSKYV